MIIFAFQVLRIKLLFWGGGGGGFGGLLEFFFFFFFLKNGPTPSNPNPLG